VIRIAITPVAEVSGWTCSSVSRLDSYSSSTQPHRHPISSSFSAGSGPPDLRSGAVTAHPTCVTYDDHRVLPASDSPPGRADVWPGILRARDWKCHAARTVTDLACF